MEFPKRKEMLLLGVLCVLSVFVKAQIEIQVHSTDSTGEGSPDATDQTKENETQVKFCTFFNNRAPTPQPDVKNCTWYKHESCCTQIEIEETFKNMKPLQGSTPKCQRYINYLMCYICSPYQFRFYTYQRLTVCEDFCDSILDSCTDATLKGTKIGELYTNGTHFCESRNLEVQKRGHESCFHFDETDDETLTGSAGHVAMGKYQNAVILSVLLVVLPCLL